MRPTAHVGELKGYTAALDGLWIDVLPTLAGLERIASEPALAAYSDLGALRYSLHRCAELAAGLPAPAGSERAHDELAEALEAARDATAVVAGALDEGGLDAVEPLVWEWRGALFMVRLAETRVAARRSNARAIDEGAAEFRRPLSRSAIVLMAAAIGLVLVVLSALPLAH